MLKAFLLKVWSVKISCMRNTLQETPYDPIFGSKVERMRLVENKDVNNKNILDIGCGFGWCAWNLLQRGAKSITGIDISNDASEVFKAIHNTKIKFRQASALDLPFTSNKFDTVVSWETIEHVPKNTEAQMLSEVFRVLKPGGVFYMSTQHRNIVSTVLDPAWWLIGHRHYPTSEIASMVNKAGFKITRLYTKGGIFTVLFMLNLYFAKWILKRPPILEEAFKRKCTQEFGRQGGFTNIFLKCTKPVSS